MIWYDCSCYTFFGQEHQDAAFISTQWVRHVGHGRSRNTVAAEVLRIVEEWRIVSWTWTSSCWTAAPQRTQETATLRWRLSLFTRYICRVQPMITVLELPGYEGDFPPLRLSVPILYNGPPLGALCRPPRSTHSSWPNKVGLKCPSVRPPIRPQKVSSMSMKFGMWVEVDEWRMTVCNMNRSKVKVTSPLKSEIRQYSAAISSPIYNGGWQVTTDS